MAEPSAAATPAGVCTLELVLTCRPTVTSAPSGYWAPMSMRERPGGLRVLGAGFQEPLSMKSLGAVEDMLIVGGRQVIEWEGAGPH